MRSQLTVLCLAAVSGFGGIDLLGGDTHWHTVDQSTQPGQHYNVGFHTQNPDHYDERGHFVGDYPAQYLVNQGMVDRLPAKDKTYDHDGGGRWYDSGSPWQSGSAGSMGKTDGGGVYTATEGDEFPHGDIDGIEVPEMTITGGADRRLSAADADSALLEAAKAGAHESLEGVNLDEASLPALMTEV